MRKIFWKNKYGENFFHQKIPQELQFSAFRIDSKVHVSQNVGSDVYDIGKIYESLGYIACARAGQVKSILSSI